MQDKNLEGRQPAIRKSFSASVRTVTRILGELWSLGRPASWSCALTRITATVSLVERSLRAAAAVHLWCQKSRNFRDVQSLEISLRVSSGDKGSKQHNIQALMMFLTLETTLSVLCVEQS